MAEGLSNDRISPCRLSGGPDGNCVVVISMNDKYPDHIYRGPSISAGEVIKRHFRGTIFEQIEAPLKDRSHDDPFDAYWEPDFLFQVRLG